MRLIRLTRSSVWRFRRFNCRGTSGQCFPHIHSLCPDGSVSAPTVRRQNGTQQPSRSATLIFSLSFVVEKISEAVIPQLLRSVLSHQVRRLAHLLAKAFEIWADARSLSRNEVEEVRDAPQSKSDGIDGGAHSRDTSGAALRTPIGRNWLRRSDSN